MASFVKIKNIDTGTDHFVWSKNLKGITDLMEILDLEGYELVIREKALEG